MEKVQHFLYRFKPYRAKFRDYYRDNGWRNAESVSGPGSTLKATQIIRQELPRLFDEFKIRTVLDIPCGDFHWMKSIDLKALQYIGADIVEELVDANTSKYQTVNTRFVCLDMIKDALPKADLCICRDCLPHYSTEYIIKAITNMKNSGSKYILTTTYLVFDTNEEIEAIGLFRPLNLEKPPFDFPPPLAVIDEGRTNGKALALWRLDDLVVSSS